MKIDYFPNNISIFDWYMHPLVRSGLFWQCYSQWFTWAIKIPCIWVKAVLMLPSKLSFYHTVARNHSLSAWSLLFKPCKAILCLDMCPNIKSFNYFLMQHCILSFLHINPHYHHTFILAYQPTLPSLQQWYCHCILLCILLLLYNLLMSHYEASQRMQKIKIES